MQKLTLGVIAFLVPVSLSIQFAIPGENAIENGGPYLYDWALEPSLGKSFISILHS